jgi:serine/threonine protein kinase
MGAVYEAVDERLRVTVALKETFAVDEQLRRQFEQEARLLAQLNHSALPRVSDFFTENERTFLVMQFIAGVDLAAVLNEQIAPFPCAQVITWADQLLDALVYLHTRERQIIHRDIKPQNLKLTASGQVVLLDFGLAKAHAPDVSTTSSSIFGYTRRYSPIEQMQDEGTTAQSDIYALGATLYHLVTAVKPPDALVRAGAVASLKADPLRPPDEINRRIPAQFSKLLMRALAVRPSDRFGSAAEFRQALHEVERMQTDSAKPATHVSRPNKAARTNRSASRLTDPFASYSILKPSDSSFTVSEARPWPAWLTVTALFVLTTPIALYCGNRLAHASRFIFDDPSGEEYENAATLPPRSQDNVRVKTKIKKHAATRFINSKKLRATVPTHVKHRTK